VFRTASTPYTSKKVPADQRIHFSPDEVKKLKWLNEQIGSKLYIEGISTEKFMNALAKDGRPTLSNLNIGLSKLKLNFSPEDTNLLLRKYSALASGGKINFSEFSHLFPKVEEDMKENIETNQNDKELAGEHKDRAKPQRALTLNPFPQPMNFKHDTDSEASMSGHNPDDMSDDEDERQTTPPHEVEEF